MLLLLSVSLQQAQTPLAKILFEQQPVRSTTLMCMRQKGIVYVSLNDVARLCSLTVQEDRVARFLSFSLGTREARFFADNPFVVLSGLTGQKSTHQLVANVIVAANAYYAPLSSCPPIFEHLLGIPVTYHPQTLTLRIGKSAFQRPAFDITTLKFEVKTNGMLIRVPAARRFTDCETLLKKDGWLYVTIPRASADVASLNKIKPEGFVRRILAIQSATSLQLTFKLEGKIASAEIIQDETTNDVLITIYTQAPPVQSTKETLPRRNVQRNLESHRKRYELDVIVLDAGHGGKDPGTIGITGVKEKDVALGIVLKLGKLIEKNMKDVKVVYTRTSDTFVELDRRGRIANEANGKLFISIHCNAMPRKPSPRRGFEVYLLRPGRTDEAIAIAERENSVIELEEGYEQRYKKLTDENFILVTMAQSAHMKSSERFAELVSRELDRRVPTSNNGVLQAGFFVLVGASMPNVLIETAYLSNREDEKLLNSAHGQQQYAEAIFKAIMQYKQEYERLLQEGKELGTK